MPDVPVAAPAPSAPAPVSTPAAPTPAPAAPVAPAPTPAAEPAAPAIPAAPDAPAAPAVDAPAATPDATAAPSGAPKREDYPQTPEGIEKFLKDTYAFEEANPDGVELKTPDEVPVVDPAAPVEKTPEEIAAEAAAKEEAAKLPEAADVTPQELAELFTADPALKDAIEANPAAKGKLFAMARQNAKAAPILDLLPNVEAAKFAVDNANQFVGLKTSFLTSDTPEKMKDAAGQFLEQFQIVDEKGAPVLDAKGNPTYGDDLPLFVSEIKGRDNAVRMADLKERIAAGQYATEAGRDNDAQLLAAYEFIAAAEAADAGALDVPDASTMTPEQKAWYEKQQKEIADEKERLGIKDKELTRKQVVETRAKMDTTYRTEFGKSTGTYLTNYLAQKEKDGVVIPSYLLSMKDPKTGISAFALTAYKRLNEKLDSQPDYKSHSATLQMNAVNEQGLANRVKWGQERVDELLPAILDGMLKEAGISMAADAKKVIEKRDDKRADARIEPAAGTPSSPRNMTDEQLYAQAKVNVAKKFEGQYIAPEKMMEETLKERDRLEASR